MRGFSPNSSKKKTGEFYWPVLDHLPSSGPCIVGKVQNLLTVQVWVRWSEPTPPKPYGLQVHMGRWVHQRKIEVLFPEKWNIYHKKGKYTTHTHTWNDEFGAYISLPHQTEPMPLHGAQWWSFKDSIRTSTFLSTLWKCMGAPFLSLGNMVINCLCLLNISASYEAIYESWCSLHR